MPENPFKNFIILTGSGKNVGKTYLATALIRSFSAKFPLLALKISPHVHDSLGMSMLRSAYDGIRIFQDLGPHRKNSGQFLEAGALQSFFMETDDEHLAEAFNIFINECNPLHYPVICESGALSRLIRPGILIFISRDADDLPGYKRSAMHQADLVLPAKSFSASAIIDRIDHTKNGWQYLYG